MLIVGIAGLIVFLLARTLGGIDFAEVLTAVRRLSATSLAGAVALTAVGYLWLIGYDALALRYLRRSVPWPRLVLTSLSAFPLQRNVGPAPLTGGAVRYRFYRRYGFSAADAAIVTVLCGLFFTMGIVLLAGLALLLQPQGLAQVLPIPAWVFRTAGAGLLIGLTAYLCWTYYRQHPMRIRGWQVPPPSIRLSLLQLLFGVIDLAIVAGVVYVLLPAEVALGYPAFLGLYVLAMVVGALSHVPGGLGVFESVLVVLLPGASASTVLASLLAFRGIYYLLPLLLMGSAVGLRESGRQFAELLGGRK